MFKKDSNKLFIFSITLLIITLLAGTVTLSSIAQAAEKKPQINMLLCPMGCGAIEGNILLETVIKRKDLPFHLNSQETPGYNYNLIEMAKSKDLWKHTIFSTEDDVVALAAHADKPEVKPFFKEPIKNRWKILYSEGLCTYGMFFQTLNPEIKSIEQLKGKRIGLGLRGQSCWGMNGYILLAKHGITPENTKIYFLGPAKAVDELLAGKIDGMVTGVYISHDQKNYTIPGMQLILDAAGRDIFYLTPDRAVYEKINREFGTVTQIIKIPARTLPKQKIDLYVGADRIYNVAHESFPEELAYQFVKAVATIGPTLKASHTYWTIVTPTEMLNGLSEENTHPGAIRAFKELGLWDLRKKFKPVISEYLR
ncbi:MAG: TAXI family TRAP transporter solute-binding subunit [Nitrospirota bacterium]